MDRAVRRTVSPSTEKECVLTWCDEKCPTPCLVSSNASESPPESEDNIPSASSSYALTLSLPAPGYSAAVLVVLHGRVLLVPMPSGFRLQVVVKVDLRVNILDFEALGEEVGVAARVTTAATTEEEEATRARRVGVFDSTDEHRAAAPPGDSTTGAMPKVKWAASAEGRLSEVEREGVSVRSKQRACTWHTRVYFKRLKTFVEFNFLTCGGDACTVSNSIHLNKLGRARAPFCIATPRVKSRLLSFACGRRQSRSSAHAYTLSLGTPTHTTTTTASVQPRAAQLKTQIQITKRYQLCQRQ